MKRNKGLSHHLAKESARYEYIYEKYNIEIEERNRKDHGSTCCFLLGNTSDFSLLLVCFRMSPLQLVQTRNSGWTNGAKELI